MEMDYPITNDIAEVPMSRTHQYRKVMKPLLERKRRARINKCLDELKDLMVYALQSEGESITKLEKADVLELTVRHLQKLKRQQMLKANPSLDIDRYQAGFRDCAGEVSRCMATLPGVDIHLGTNVMTHLGLKLKNIEQSRLSPLSVTVPSTSPDVPTTGKNIVHRPEPLVRAALPQEQQPMKYLHTPAHSDGGYSSGRESVSPRSINSSSPVNFVKREMDTASNSSVWRPF